MRVRSPLGGGETCEEPAEVVQGLRPYHPSPSREDECGNAGDAQPAGLRLGRLAPGSISAAGKPHSQSSRVEPRLFGRPDQDLDVADVLRAGKVRSKDLAVELGVAPRIPGELGGLYGKPGVGEQHRCLEMQSQFDTAAAQTLLALAYSRAEQPFKQHALRRRFGMDLVADPLVLEWELTLQRIDNTRADIAEGSYVVGEYPDVDGLAVHIISPISSRPPQRCRG